MPRITIKLTSWKRSDGEKMFHFAVTKPFSNDEIGLFDETEESGGRDWVMMKAEQLRDLLQSTGVEVSIDSEI